MENFESKLKQSLLSKTTQELTNLLDNNMLIDGNPYASIVVVKRLLDKDSSTSDTFLHKDDGQALRKACVALGFAPNDFCGISTTLCKNPQEDLRLSLTALDPLYVILCDEQAQTDYEAEFLDNYHLKIGCLEHLPMHVVLALGNFSQALKSTDTKQAAWRALKSLARPNAS